MKLGKVAEWKGEHKLGKTKARNPIREEKELMSKAGLIVRNWYVLKNTEEELVLVSKASGRTRRIRKEQIDVKRRVSKPRT